MVGSFGSLGINADTKADTKSFSSLAFPLYLKLLGTRRAADVTDALFLTSSPRFFLSLPRYPLSLHWFQVLTPAITKNMQWTAVLFSKLRAYRVEAENRAGLKTDGNSHGSSSEGLRAGTSLCFRELVASDDFEVHFHLHEPTLLYLSAGAHWWGTQQPYLL